MRKAGWFVVFLLAAGILSSESLWDPNSTGYYTGRYRLHEGDFLHVVLTGEASLSYKASRATTKSLSMTFGSSTAGLPTLGPGNSTESDKAEASSDLKIKNFQLTVRVVSVDSRGFAKIEGHRSVLIGGGEESLSLTGTIDSRNVHGNDIAWTDVADLVLVYQNASESARPVLKGEDFSSDGKTLLPSKRQELERLYLNRFLDSFSQTKPVSP
jgi:flagellar basal body L-ring protein FlgH